MAALADGLAVGDPLEKATEVGPLVSARQRERVLDYIDVGKSEGGKVVAGGSVPADQPRGWFVSPTVFADVDNSARIAQEEIFGPVLAVIPYDTDREAIDIANDSEFGLGGTVWSTDADRATDVARAVRTGTIGVNDYQLDMQAPFGGVKASGMGRELGPEGLAAYQTLKSIYRVGPRLIRALAPAKRQPSCPSIPERRCSSATARSTSTTATRGRARRPDGAGGPGRRRSAGARSRRLGAHRQPVVMAVPQPWRAAGRRRIGATRADGRYTTIGGNVPQSLVNQACLDIQRGARTPC